MPTVEVAINPLSWTQVGAGSKFSSQLIEKGGTVKVQFAATQPSAGSNVGIELRRLQGVTHEHGSDAAWAKGTGLFAVST